MKKQVAIIGLVLLGLAYFIVMIVPNQTGAADATMLSAFEHDEFAQYPNVIHMLQQGDNPYQTLRNFLIYQHYYYGYPFYFFSAIVLLPVKWIIGADWTSSTQLIVTVLRQMINVLPMLLAALLLVIAQVRSNKPWKAWITFLLLLTLPAVIGNDLWWHPDSLLTLFSVLTILFLILDDGKFGKYFYFSAITCALAIGAKILGVLFILTYASYLVYGLATKKASLRKVLISAMLFLLALIASVIISNPLLALPIERGEIIATFKANLSQSSEGFWIAGNGMSDKFGSLLNMIKENYGGVILFLVSVGTTIYGLFNQEKRIKNLVILTWAIGYLGYFFFFASTLRSHYLIPAILPLYSTLLDVIPESPWPSLKNKKGRVVETGITLILLLFVGVAIGMNIWKSIGTIQQTTQREETSGSLALFKVFQEEILPEIPEGEPLVIYRDWRAYVADNPHWRVLYNWDLANYDYLNENDPDILFIEKDNVLYFSDDAKLSEALDRELMQRMNQFYSDVLDEQVTGYHLLEKSSFGYIFVSDELFTSFFQ